MNLLTVENMTKSYGEKLLFHNITFGVSEGDKIGLIGVNGTGKSTFLNVIAGLDIPDQGKLTSGNHVIVRYLPQNPKFEADITVLEHVCLEGMTADAEENSQLEFEAKAILMKLGMADYDANVGTLSGGQRKRVAIATALLHPADVLILDEPTNHIDNESVVWLEQYLNKRKGALLMVTHDRYFLDRVANRIAELDKGQLHTYTGNYSYFLEKKADREEREQSSELKRQNLFRNELAWIRRGAKARSTKQKARIDRFETLKEGKPEASLGKVDISVGGSRLGKKVIELEHISKSFEDKLLIRNFDFIIQRDDRIGIIGPNGSGKSTLLQIISGKLTADQGNAIIGQTVKIGWFAQENEELNGAMRVIDYIKEAAHVIMTADGETITAAQMLERFLFSPTLQWTPIAKLSGGEKRRLYLLRVLMEAPNVLMLDEPTNDLDIQTLSVLEQYLDNFPGAVIVVSHDRYFLDRVTEKIVAFEGNGILTISVGNYTEYQEMLKRRSAEEDEISSANIPSRAANSGVSVSSMNKGQSNINSTRSDKSRALKFTFNEQREYDQIDDLITDKEQQLEKVNAGISETGSDYLLLQQLTEQQRGLELELEELMERWAYLTELAEQIANLK